jgi:hypothetical protein
MGYGIASLALIAAIVALPAFLEAAPLSGAAFASARGNSSDRVGPRVATLSGTAGATLSGALVVPPTPATLLSSAGLTVRVSGNLRRAGADRVLSISTVATGPSIHGSRGLGGRVAVSDPGDFLGSAGGDDVPHLVVRESGETLRVDSLNFEAAIAPASVPEPASLLLLASGLGLVLGGAARRRRR